MLQNFGFIALGLLLGYCGWAWWQSRQHSASGSGSQIWAMLCQLHPEDALLLIAADGSILDLNVKAGLWLGMNAQRGQSAWPLFSAIEAPLLRQFCHNAEENDVCSLHAIGLNAAEFTDIDVDLEILLFDKFSRHFVIKLSRYWVAQSAQSRGQIVDSIKENLLNSNISAIVAVDEDDRIVEFNPCAERLFGYQRSAVLGNTMADLLIPPAYRAMHYAGMRRFISEGSTRIMNKRVEVAAINAQGQEFPIEIEVSPSRQGDRWLFIAVIQDISERKQSAVQMQQALLQAEAANQRKTRFLTSVSHEIRTPLHAILGLIECLQHTALNDQQLQYIHLAQAAGENLLNMVNDVLDLGAIEAGKRQVHASVFNPRTLIDEHLDIYRHRIEEKGLALYLIEAADAPNRVYSDITIVRQILTNLLSNACQYTTEGAITVRSWYRALDAKEGQWCCQISDTGPGFTETQLSQLFHEFTRFHPEQSKGSGVGLMICRHLTELLGGTLEVSSQPGQGAAFTLKLAAQPRRPRRTFRMLHQQQVFLWSENNAWRLCLTEQLQALGVTQIAQLQIDQLATLPEGALVIVDDAPKAHLVIAPYLSKRADLKLISAVSDDSSGWKTCPRHFAFITQPYRQAELLCALRAAIRQQPRSLREAKYTAPHLMVMPPTSSQAFHVLLVDDSEVNRLTIKTFLGLEGIKVTEAVDGEDACEKVRQQPFDLILMDLRMPVMGGLEATRQIRAQQLADRTPIIALTAHVQEEEKQQCLQAGMQDFLTKPIGKAMLLKRVQQWLQSQEKTPEKVATSATSATSATETAIAGFYDAPLVDEALLRNFQAELSAENYQRLIGIFLSESTRQIAEAQQFVEQQQTDRVEILVHALKSSALTFGAVRLSLVAKAAEQACRQQQDTDIAELCQLLAEVSEQTHVEFARR